MNHPDHYVVPYVQLSNYRVLHEPDNTDALCNECPEYATPDFLSDGGCSDSCGGTGVWVKPHTFVKLKLEGMV